MVLCEVEVLLRIMDAFALGADAGEGAYSGSFGLALVFSADA